jgi:fructokinase
LGIDLGGTKTEIVALAPDDTIAVRRRVPTPSASYDAILTTIVDLVGGVEAELGTHDAPVGIGTPGSLSPATGRIRNANSTVLNDRPLLDDLRARLGERVRVANDANCFALSEAHDGAGAGAPVVFGVILGTGVGGGIVVDGRLLSGRNLIAGEWGHNPLPWPRDDERGTLAPRCYCGKHGCIETFLSGPGFAREYAAAGGGAATASEIVERAATGDVLASAAFEHYLDRLTRALAHVIDILDPDCIVLGGGVSNVAALYREIPRRWDAYVFSDVVATPLVRAMHGDSSGVRGAARLWPLRTGPPVIPAVESKSTSS